MIENSCPLGITFDSYLFVASNVLTVIALVWIHITAFILTWALIGDLWEKTLRFWGKKI